MHVFGKMKINMIAERRNTMKKVKQGISLISLLVLLFVFLCPSSVFASTQAQYEAQRDINRVLQYAITNPDKSISFDEEAAKANGESSEILAIGNLMEEIAIEYFNGSQGIATYGLPVYGNWCGPGYGSGTPIDYLDAACKAHDVCYGRDGYFNCDCDLEIINRINSQLHLMSGEELNTAKAVVAYFTAQREAFCCDGCGL